MQIIVQTSDQATRALLQRLKNLNISEIWGQNVRIATSLIPGALQRLEMVDAIPSDIVIVLLNIYQTTSYHNFNEIFRTMKIALKIQPSSTYKISDITKIAETNFQELYESGIWQRPESDTVFINRNKNFQHKNNTNDSNNNNNDQDNNKNQGAGKGGRGKEKEKVKEETKTIQNTSCQVPENQPQRFGKASRFIGVQSASVGVPTQPRSIVVTSVLTTLQRKIQPVPHQPTLIQLPFL